MNFTDEELKKIIDLLNNTPKVTDRLFKQINDLKKRVQELESNSNKN